MGEGVVGYGVQVCVHRIVLPEYRAIGWCDRYDIVLGVARILPCGETAFGVTKSVWAVSVDASAASD